MEALANCRSPGASAYARSAVLVATHPGELLQSRSCIAERHRNKGHGCQFSRFSGKSCLTVLFYRFSPTSAARTGPDSAWLRCSAYVALGVRASGSRARLLACATGLSEVACLVVLNAKATLAKFTGCSQARARHGGPKVSLRAQASSSSSRPDLAGRGKHGS